MAKPTVLPEWNSGGTNNTQPTAPKKVLGWTVGEAPSSASFNWYMKLVFDWITYVSQAQFTAGTGGIGLQGTGSAPGGTGVKGVGFGASGTGVSGVGAGSGAGGGFSGGSTGPGILAIGGASAAGAYGIRAIGGDKATGVRGEGGADSNGDGYIYGVQGVGDGGQAAFPPSGGPFYNLNAGVMGTSTDAYGGMFLSTNETALIARTQAGSKYGIWSYHENGTAIFGQTGLGGGIGVSGAGFAGGIGIQGDSNGGIAGNFAGAGAGSIGVKAIGVTAGGKFYSNAGSGIVGYAQDESGTPSTGTIPYGVYGIGASGETDYSASPYAAAIDPTALAGYTRGSHGVRGASVSEIGVLGTSNTGYGVMGVVDTDTGTKEFGGWGVVGLNYSGSSGSSGAIFGRTINGTGIKGSSDNGIGVLGEANGGIAGQFTTQPNPGAIGVSGQGYSGGGVFQSENGHGVMGSAQYFGNPSTGTDVYGVYGVGSDGPTDFTGSPNVTTLNIYASGLHGIKGSTQGVDLSGNNTYGVIGTSRYSVGVFGISDAAIGAGIGSYGVVGLNYSSDYTVNAGPLWAAGVFGSSTGNGIGVQAASTDGFAVNATVAGNGIAGRFTTSPGAGTAIEARGWNFGIKAQSELGPAVTFESTNGPNFNMIPVVTYPPVSTPVNGDFLYKSNSGNPFKYYNGSSVAYEGFINSQMSSYTVSPAYLTFGATTGPVTSSTTEYVWPGYGFPTSTDEVGVLLNSNLLQPDGGASSVYVHSLVVRCDGLQDDTVTFQVRVNGTDVSNGGFNLAVTLNPTDTYATIGTGDPLQQVLFTYAIGDEVTVSCTTGAGLTVPCGKIRITVLATSGATLQ